MAGPRPAYGFSSLTSDVLQRREFTDKRTVRCLQHAVIKKVCLAEHRVVPPMLWSVLPSQVCMRCKGSREPGGASQTKGPVSRKEFVFVHIRQVTAKLKVVFAALLPALKEKGNAC